GGVAGGGGVGAEAFARDGAEVREQPEAANTGAAIAQPRTFSHFSGDPRAMSSALQRALGAARCLRAVASGTGRRHAKHAATQAEYTPTSELFAPSPE